MSPKGLVEHLRRECMTNFDKQRITPFWNCEGSYYYKLLAKQNLNQSLMEIFSDSEIVCQVIENEKIKEQYLQNSNPWGFQPIFLRKKGKRFIFEDEIATYFQKHQIIKKIHVREEIDDLYGLIEKNVNNNLGVIINVDEYYISYSKFFKKKHNKHSVLIEDIIERKILVSDSERSSKQEITVTELEQAFFKSCYRHMYCQLIDFSKCVEEQNDLANEEISKKDNIKYIFDLMRLFQIIYDDKDKNIQIYSLLGIRFCISFKIIPFYKQKIGKNQDEKVYQLLNLWEKLANIIIIKTHFDRIPEYDSIMKLLNDIGELINISDSCK